ncbi:RNA demethylase ALKBH10B-like [Zingiber officinale]|nr:RNA demethylase ALKBH10B-like [Zingiber officinale]
MATVGAGARASVAVPGLYVQDAMISWFQSEFAAANAIIDALCGHLAQIGSEDEYGEFFASVHRRRLNWIPALHMQKYYSIADVSAKLRLVASNRVVPKVNPLETLTTEEKPSESEIPSTEAETAASLKGAVADDIEIVVAEEAAAEDQDTSDELVDDNNEIARIDDEASAMAELSSGGDSSEYKNNAQNGDANGGSQEEHASVQKVHICADHGDCFVCPERIKISKGFMAKELVKGHMVNVVKGLRLYQDIFSESELPSLVGYINELRMAGHKGELSGETFIFFNKQMKGSKREIIQLGVPLFQSATEDAASNFESIPPALQAIVDHLVQWRLIPESKKPNSCIINFFDEDEHSQPYFKPPHLENPISMLLLSETTMAFGHSFISNHEGNYNGSLTLSLKQGSLLVMRGHSADIARHVVCASPNRRMIITFVKVRTATHHADSPTALQANTALTVWQPGNPTSIQEVPSSGAIAYGPQAMVSTAWGLALRSPVVMLAPPRAVAMSVTDKKVPCNGTGVFLPWAVRSKKHTKHLPPRIQKRRLPSFPQLEAQA